VEEAAAARRERTRLITSDFVESGSDGSFTSFSISSSEEDEVVMADENSEEDEDDEVDDEDEDDVDEESSLRLDSLSRRLMPPFGMVRSSSVVVEWHCIIES